MAKVIFENLTNEQALELSSWYECQGENDAYEWFSDRRLKTPNTNCQRVGGYRDINKETGDITVYCK